MKRVVHIGLLLAIAVPGAHAATIELHSGESFEAAAESLQPGDTLIVHAGTYQDSGRIAITVKGTAASPVVIKAAANEARPVIGRRSTDPLQNTIDIVGATYLTISGLEITGNPGDGGDGINMRGAVSYVTLQDLKIHAISVGINFRDSMHHITVRRNEIYDTNNTGEGIYVGCHDGTCAVHDSLIENNRIHHTLHAEQGDGIEMKKGSYGNVVRDNVIHDTRYPCIIAYGTQGNPRNVIERNVVWNCADAGMQVAADAVIRNNIIFARASVGFLSQDHNGVTPNNLQFVHNTVVGGAPCLRLDSWSGKTGLVFANNAVYCATGTYIINGASNVTVVGNVFDTVPPSFPAGGYKLGRAVALDLTDIAARNVYPTASSTLIGAAAAAWLAADDFNGKSRTGTLDAGAYAHTTAANPGCAIVAGLKCATSTTPTPAPAPQVTLTATPTSIAHQAATLSWTSTNATSCSAEGAWSGAKDVSGSASTGALTAQQTYTLECVNSDGVPASASVTVAVAAAPSTPSPSPSPTPAPTPTPSTPEASGSGGGGGALDPLLLAIMGGMAWSAARRRRSSRLRPM